MENCLISSGGCNYTYPIEDLVERYRKEFKESKYSIVHYDIHVNDFEAWLCEQLEKERKNNVNEKSNKKT